MNGITPQRIGQVCSTISEAQVVKLESRQLYLKKLLVLPAVTTAHTEKLERGLQLP